MNRSNRYAQFIMLILGISKQIQRLKSEKAAKEGIKSVNIMCLWQLLDEPDGLTANELANKCYVDKSLISRELAKMEKSGLVRCEMAIVNNRYSRRIILTDRGRQIAEDITDIVADVTSKVKVEISGEEIKIFYRVLRKFYSGLQKYELDADDGENN